MGCHTLLQKTFLTQRLNSLLLHLLDWRAGFLPLVPPMEVPYISIMAINSTGQHCSRTVNFWFQDTFKLLKLLRVLNYWFQNWNSNTLANSCEELTHWKRLWCWEGLGAGGEGDDRGWDGWMASLTGWMWVWVNSGSWWWTGRPGVLRVMGSQRVGQHWVTELNWTDGSLLCRSGITLYRLHVFI